MLPHQSDRFLGAKRAGCSCEQKAGGRLVGRSKRAGQGTAGLEGARTGPRHPAARVPRLTCASGQTFPRNRFDSDGTAHPGSPAQACEI